MIKSYQLPIFGTVTDWETFKGNVNDPVLCTLALDKFSSLTPDSLKERFSANVKEIDVDTGEALVEVEASAEFHGRFLAFLQTMKDNDLSNKKRLKRPKNQPEPTVSLKFNQK